MLDNIESLDNDTARIIKQKSYLIPSKCPVKNEERHICKGFVYIFAQSTMEVVTLLRSWC